MKRKWEGLYFSLVGPSSQGYNREWEEEDNLEKEAKKEGTPSGLQKNTWQLHLGKEDLRAKIHFFDSNLASSHWHFEMTVLVELYIMHRNPSQT